MRRKQTGVRQAYRERDANGDRQADDRGFSLTSTRGLGKGISDALGKKNEIADAVEKLVEQMEVKRVQAAPVGSMANTSEVQNKQERSDVPAG